MPRLELALGDCCLGKVQGQNVSLSFVSLSLSLVVHLLQGIAVLSVILSPPLDADGLDRTMPVRTYP